MKTLPEILEEFYESAFTETEQNGTLHISLINGQEAIAKELMECLPEKHPDAAKQGDIIPFDRKKKVEMHWLRKTQDAGFNQALDEVRARLTAFIGRSGDE